MSIDHSTVADSVAVAGRVVTPPFTSGVSVGRATYRGIPYEPESIDSVDGSRVVGDPRSVDFCGEIVTGCSPALTRFLIVVVGLPVTALVLFHAAGLPGVVISGVVWTAGMFVTEVVSIHRFHTARSGAGHG